MAVQRHYVSYADLLKIRYSPFDCLIMVGTEDRLVREANSYIIQRVRFCLQQKKTFLFILCYRHSVVDLLNLNMQGMDYQANVPKKLMANYSVTSKTCYKNEIVLIHLEWYESIRTNEPTKVKREIPEEYKIEIKALEQCCQHRTHCLVHDVVGLLKVKCGLDLQEKHLIKKKFSF